MIDRYSEVLEQLLMVEHKSTALKLNLIGGRKPVISVELLNKSIGLIDLLSRERDDLSKQKVIVLSSILYTYRRPEWEGLNQFLVIVLSRIGFAPSAVMVDEQFDHETNRFSPLDSLFGQLGTVVNLARNEVYVADKWFQLTDFQMNIWEKCTSSKFVGISAPTSAGKSYVILLKSLKNIKEHEGNIVYVVPTLSLITQVVQDYHQKLKEFGLEEYSILTGFHDGDNQKKIYILTAERAISAYSQTGNPFGEVNTFIVDEIQNIERIENEKDERSKILFDSLVELSFSSDPRLVIFSGPRVSGLKKLGFDIFKQALSDEIETFSSPVSNFTYSISLRAKKYFFNQFSQVTQEQRSIEIKNTEAIKIGGKQYDDRFFQYLGNVINSLGNDRNIIFAPSSGIARKIAKELSQRIDVTYSKSLQLTGLINYISDTVHTNYDLIKTLQNGVAYHHGKVPLHIRNVLEYAIKEKWIENVICTTTLMQGVNMPAQNVVMRNGYLSTKEIKGVMPKLTNYEISNLRGRAGRLLKDFIGRTFILDENAFDSNSEQAELFKDENKSLTSGYGNIFEKFSDRINESVFENISNEDLEDSIGGDFRFLVTYIRQTILRHKNDSVKRLAAVGVRYTAREVNKIRTELIAQLDVPLDTCFKNRYIDPLVLNDIYLTRDKFVLPTAINEYGFAEKLFSLVEKIKVNFPALYQKFFDKKDLPQNFFYTVADWAKEKPLKEMLAGTYFNESNNIDKIIDQIQQNVCYNLTALLKPFYGVILPESKLISCIETGAYTAVTLRLIQLNVPREVAISLKRSIFDSSGIDVKSLDDKVVQQVIKDNYDTVGFWNRIQISHLV